MIYTVDENGGYRIETRLVFDALDCEGDLHDCENANIASIDIVHALDFAFWIDPDVPVSWLFFVPS